MKVRDTTGAGDVFHGALAAGLCAGTDLPAALDLAARAAALNCTALGATSKLLGGPIPRSRARVAAP